MYKLCSRATLLSRNKYIYALGYDRFLILFFSSSPFAPEALHDFVILFDIPWQAKLHEHLYLPN